MRVNIPPNERRFIGLIAGLLSAENVKISTRDDAPPSSFVIQNGIEVIYRCRTLCNEAGDVAVPSWVFTGRLFGDNDYITIEEKDGEVTITSDAVKIPLRGDWRTGVIPVRQNKDGFSLLAPASEFAYVICPLLKEQLYELLFALFSSVDELLKASYSEEGIQLCTKNISVFIPLDGEELS